MHRSAHRRRGLDLADETGLLFEQEFRRLEEQMPALARELRRAAGERLAAARA